MARDPAAALIAVALLVILMLLPRACDRPASDSDMRMRKHIDFHDEAPRVSPIGEPEAPAARAGSG